ncbi:MAG: membrane dipeptidase [Planctomycetaceae bacterium]
MVGPAHYGPNEYCHGTGSRGGLSDDGRQLICEMDRAGLLLDVTHLSDDSMSEALDLFSGPVLASHHNCRALVPGDRQLSDEQIRRLIDRGAVIGTAFDNWMLTPGWIKTVTSPSTVTLDHVVEQIDHVCQLAGSVRHSGLGTDLDGGFGQEQSPSDLDSIGELGLLREKLADRGYDCDDIHRILWGNFVDLMATALPSTPTTDQTAGISA